MAANDSYRLIVRRGPQPNQTFDLDKDIVTLGRDITNDIVINDPEVSRHHLRFTRGADGHSMEDLGSTNGTFVNGQRMTGVRPLNRGDMIGLGETVTLGYDIARPASQDAPPPAPVEPAPASQAPDAPQAPGYQPPQPAPPQQQAPPPQDQAYAPPPPQPSQDPQGQRYQPEQPAGYDYDPRYGEPQAEYAYGGPQAPPGYDYDPYAIREDDSGSALRWVMIGCAIISVFCCCSSVIGIVIIDALELWYDLPIIEDLTPLFESIAEALGFI